MILIRRTRKPLPLKDEHEDARVALALWEAVTVARQRQIKSAGELRKILRMRNHRDVHIEKALVMWANREEA